MTDMTDMITSDTVASVSLEDADRDPQHFSQELGKSFVEYGFAIVRDHGIPAELIARAEQKAKAFFALPEEVKRKYHVEAETHTPKVAYLESIKGKAEVQGKHKKQSGGHGQYGDVHIRLAPNARRASVCSWHQPRQRGQRTFSASRHPLLRCCRASIKARSSASLLQPVPGNIMDKVCTCPSGPHSHAPTAMRPGLGAAPPSMCRRQP